VTRALAPADVVVAGGGLAAVAIALELARRDLVVDLLATAKAGVPCGPGGPVAAQGGVEPRPEPLADLSLLSRHLYSDWVSGLEEETGLPCEYDERGAMTVALDEEEEVAFDRALDADRQRGLHFEVLGPEEARGREPALSRAVRAAFASTRDGVARAGRVGRALVLSARAAGVRVREAVGPLGIAVPDGRLEGVETPAGLLPAETVVLARRSGPEGVVGAPRLGLVRTTRTWLRLDASGDPDRPSRLLVSRGAILVPRRDGSMLAFGSAAPDTGARGSTAGRVAVLLEALAQLVPASTAWRLDRSGAKVEHGAPDGCPVLGETGMPGLFVASGWGADELLLAPAAAGMVADLVTGRTPPVAAGPFRPFRTGA
jgi:glycine oxidase